MANRSKMDPNQILKIVFDEELEACRVQLLPTEFAVDIRAEDGDSVQTQKQMNVIPVQAGEVIDTSKACRMTVTVATEISMIVGDVEIPLGSVAPGYVKEICSPQIKVTEACTVILQS